ncbi:NAD(P)/FAD-dependent oxidoreductase [Georgenia sp. SYP-B2076]|uniref:NAD(P)/FAD-dependent oxidoreductase n=1 Tax=Georgenia sp. SYP-B2076 TaxID=2495881 RepID=UPI000F8F0C21|nr:FAD-dependent oxidoreductase [Georgenia sp. SYP-B2076]
MPERTFVIVGGGLAGARAATFLRKEGFDGRVVIVGAETDPPYIRPPLSKEYLRGAAERAEADVHPAGWYADNGVELLLGRRATGLDLAGHVVDLDDGEVLGYTKLLLATGASPRRLGPGSGEDLGGVHYLRTAGDSEALRADLSAGGRRLVIVGSGWIGLEVAAVARGYGNEVVVLGRDPVPLRAALGAELGGVFADLHRANGVDLRGAAAVERITGAGTAHGVVLGDGTAVGGDVVLVAIGAVPNVALAAAAGLAVDGGVVVDEHLRTAAPDVYAVGDVARFFHPALGQHIRVEHWANAQRGGPVAARSMLGQDVANDRPPYFYTDQFDLSMEYSGYPELAADAQVVYRGDREAREFIAFWVAGGRVVAGMNVNVEDVSPAIERLVRSGAPVDPARLADPAVPLEDLAA